MIVGPAVTPADIAEAGALFGAYAATLAAHLDVDGLRTERAGLPGRYAAPAGTLLLARHADGPAVGCVAVRGLALPGACELKRLFVAPGARGGGIGRALVLAALDFARAAGHRRMLLDSLPHMAGAQALYRALGFVVVPPYEDSAIPGLTFFGRDVA